MKAVFRKALDQGHLVKSNTFETEKGLYRIEMREYRNHIYFFKYRNDKLLECMDLNKASVKEEFQKDLE